MTEWVAKRRPYRLAPPWGKWRVYRSGMDEQEATELVECHNRVFPNDEHKAGPRKAKVKR